MTAGRVDPMRNTKLTHLAQPLEEGAIENDDFERLDDDGLPNNVVELLPREG
jgi:hypothetical protein